MNILKYTILSVLSVILIFVGWSIAGPLYDYFDSVTEKKANIDTGTDAPNEGETQINGEDPLEDSETHVQDEPENKGIWVPAQALNSSGRLMGYIEYAKKVNVNTFVIDIKDESGIIAYDSQLKQVMDVGAVAEQAIDIKEVLEKIKEEGMYAVARIHCFKDDYTPRKLRTAGICIRKDVLWLDNKMLRWLNPYEEESWDYLGSIALEAASLGFDEIVLDSVQFPVEGKPELIDYMENTGKSRSEALTGFVKYVHEKIKETGTKLDRKSTRLNSSH